MAENITLHEGDLPDGLTLVGDIAVDSETTGLHLQRDKLCLLQLCDAAGACHIVKFSARDYARAKNLKALMADPKRVKIFHFGRFDIAMLKRWLGVNTKPVYCTKIASKLVRTYTDRHGLKDLCKELLGVELSKQQQSSDWAADKLSDEQLAYAASDVLYLHRLRDILDGMLAREGRAELARACFDFLPSRAALDLAGWDEVDVFAHS